MQGKALEQRVTMVMEVLKQEEGEGEVLAKPLLEEFPEALTWFLPHGFCDLGPYQERGGGGTETLIKRERETWPQGDKGTTCDGREANRRQSRKDAATSVGGGRWASGSEGACGCPTEP